MKNLLIILTAITFFACDKSNDMETQYAYNFDVGLEFSILNLQNEDLLNPENPNHINEANIKLFYQINGEKQEVYNAEMDNPRGFVIFKHENKYRIEVGLNHSETSGNSITYIQWNDNDTDTIEVAIKRTQYSILQDKIWLNGILIWQRGDNTTDPYFVLTK